MKLMLIRGMSGKRAIVRVIVTGSCILPEPQMNLIPKAHVARHVLRLSSTSSQMEPNASIYQRMQRTYNVV